MQAGCSLTPDQRVSATRSLLAPVVAGSAERLLPVCVSGDEFFQPLPPRANELPACVVARSCWLVHARTAKLGQGAVGLAANEQTAPRRLTG